MSGKKAKNEIRVLLPAISMLVLVTLACGGNGPSTEEKQGTPTPTQQKDILASEEPTQEMTSAPAPTATLRSTVDTSDCALGAVFQADVTIPDNTEVKAGLSFIKTWRIRNTGTCDWGPGYTLVFVGGDQMYGPDAVGVPATPPGESAEISVELVAPRNEGQYRGNWQICVNETECFGEEVYVQVVAFAPPTPEPTPTPAPTGTPVPPLYVGIGHVSEHTDRDGDLILYGEVGNLGSLPAKLIEVNGTLYDEKGNVLALDSAYARLPWGLSIWYTGVLYPSELAPFRIAFESPGNYHRYHLDLAYSEATESDCAKHYRQLRAANHQGRRIDELLYNYRVSGEIENTGRLETGPVRIIVTVYNDEGKVVGYDDLGGTESDPFLPGDSAPFAIDLYSWETVASYRLLYRSIKH